MRRRLLLVLSLFSVLTLAAFVGPLLDQRATARAQEWTLVRNADLARFTALAAQADRPGATADLARGVRRHAELYGEGVLVVDGARRVVAGAGLAPGDPGVDGAVDAALRNQPPAPPARITPWRSGPVLLWRPVGTGTRADGAVLLAADPSAAAADVGRDWLVVLLGALAAALAVAVLALLLARWVLRPVGSLADGVRAVAEGRAGERVPDRGGPAELRELAVSFNRMSDAVRAGAERQERLVADASHQIRNPLAALRLRLDGLDPHVGGDGRGGYGSALVEMDRIERLLDGMLGLASAEATASSVAAGTAGAPRCDAAAVAVERLAGWAPAARAAGVTLDGDGDASLPVAWPAADLEQVLDVLLNNAVAHTGPGTRVTVGWSGAGDAVVLTVRDDGPGLAPDALRHATERFWRGTTSTAGGSGLGLAIVDRLVAGRAGTLALDTPDGGGFRATVTLERAC